MTLTRICRGCGCRSGAGIILATLMILLPAADALAQGRANLKDVNERLKRVERVVDQSLLDLLQQVDSLQREIRSLRGELESQTNELQTLKKRSRDLYRDTDARLTSIEEKQQEDSALDGELEEGGTSTEVEEADVTGDAGNSAVSVSSEPVVATVVSRPSGPSRAATAEEKQAYAKAYDMLASNNHDETIEEFQRFIDRYPDGPYSDNAWYWQGEALYAKRLFDMAVNNFQTVIESFPQSPKLPDARLKIGFSLYEQKRYDEARIVLNAVKNDYRGRSAAVLAQKRLNQMDKNGL